MILIPDIKKFKDFYSKMYYYRNRYSHEDDFVPKSVQVNNILRRAYEFNSFLDTQLIPNLQHPSTNEE